MDKRWIVWVADIHGNGQSIEFISIGTKEEAELSGQQYAEKHWPQNQCGVSVKEDNEV